MTSAIDTTKPNEGNALTADVRQNFQTAAAEITELQASRIFFQGQWLWQGTPQTGAMTTGLVGVDTTDWSVATTLYISRYAQDVSDYYVPILVLLAGDGLIAWDSAGNVFRYTVTGAPAILNASFAIPVSPRIGAGWNPNDQSAIYVQFVFSAG